MAGRRASRIPTPATTSTPCRRTWNRSATPNATALWRSRPVGDWTPVSGRGQDRSVLRRPASGVGAALPHSPYGVLYTRLADRGTTSMKTRAGEEIQVKVLGTLDSRRARPTPHRWSVTRLSAQALDRPDPDRGQHARCDGSCSRRRRGRSGRCSTPPTVRWPCGPVTAMALSTEPRGGAGSVTGQLIEPGKPLAGRPGRLQRQQVRSRGTAGPRARHRTIGLLPIGRCHGSPRESYRSRARRG